MSKAKKILSWVWKQIQVPLIVFSLFFFAGVGLYHGIGTSTKFGELTTGKALIITLIDLKRDEESHD